MALPTPPPAADPRALDEARTNPRRLAALRDVALLDTPPEDCFDRLTRLATLLLGTPVAFLSLVAEDHDFYKSHCGFGEPLASSRRLDGRTFCHHALAAGGPLVLDDTTAYPGYAEVPTVRTLGIRAYAGVPLVSGDGQCIGSFCAVDFVPRAWSEHDLLLLTELAQSAMREITLRQALRLADAASQAKTAFLAHISHDLRTPLNAILGFAHLLQRATLTDRQREQVQHVQTAGEQLQDQINNLLDLSKMASGKLVLEQADFELRALVDEVLQLADGQARAKGLALTAQVGEAPPWLRGDPGRLRQALLHLLSDALRCGTGGKVLLQVQALRRQTDALLLRFAVQGQGIGLALRAPPGANTDEALGASLTRRIAELMGGGCGEDSTAGQVWFTAWLAPGRAGADPAASLPAAGRAEALLRHHHAGARVLLVEDNAVNQEVAVSLLTDAGLAVHVAADGHQAVALAPRGFDLILMDMQMPGMDGLEATRHIRAQPGGASVPIVAMTANLDHDDRQRCLDAGMSDFLSKPIDPEPLFERVLHWLARPRPGH